MLKNADQEYQQYGNEYDLYANDSVHGEDSYLTPRPDNKLIVASQNEYDQYGVRMVVKCF